MDRQPGPSPEVLARFGVAGRARRLPGGQGRSWTADDLVLKPHTDPQMHAWLVSELARIDRSGFRLADPVPAADGDWIVDGWSASTFLSGAEAPADDPDRWAAIIDAGRAFHRATAVLPCPSFPGSMDTWWGRADRAAWGEQDVQVGPELQGIVRRLRSAVTPLGRAQLVHGDLTGNVLFHPSLPPAIIDVSPYWRPTAYAEGTVIADALTWHDASPALLGHADVPLGAVARGLLFRVLASQLRARDERAALTDVAARYELAAAALNL